jgi:ABC-type Co2+ transport system permease subunit
MRLELLIPLVIVAVCFLLSLLVIIYQRRRIQNNTQSKLTAQSGLTNLGTYFMFTQTKILHMQRNHFRQ